MKPNMENTSEIKSGKKDEQNFEREISFCTTTLGCKVNQFDTQAIEGMLLAEGFFPVKAGQGADLCLINTCVVTANSFDKSVKAVKRLKKLEPMAKIALCGCLSQLDPLAAQELGADFIGGSDNRQRFAEEIIAYFRNEDGVDGKDSEESEGFETLKPGAAGGRTRALLKVQDGCDNFCAYCIVPYTRGRSRSIPFDTAAKQAQTLERDGFREIVITGIEISSYGKDLAEKPSLISLVTKIAQAAPGTRLRLGSLDPSVITDDFCKELRRLNNFCPHFHLSLQSGCDKTLGGMGRKYTTTNAARAVSTIRSYYPDSGISADLIVGFPGETDEDFADSIAFIENMKFSDMHIFSYSKREGTKAAGMPDQILKNVIQKRAKIAAEISGKMSAEFRKSQIGKNVSVLFESKRGQHWVGRAENNIEVHVKGNFSKNEVCRARIVDFDGEVVVGEIH